MSVEWEDAATFGIKRSTAHNSTRSGKKIICPFKAPRAWSSDTPLPEVTAIEKTDLLVMSQTDHCSVKANEWTDKKSSNTNRSHWGKILLLGGRIFKTGFSIGMTSGFSAYLILAISEMANTHVFDMLRLRPMPNTGLEQIQNSCQWRHRVSQAPPARNSQTCCKFWHRHSSLLRSRDYSEGATLVLRPPPLTVTLAVPTCVCLDVQSCPAVWGEGILGW